MQQEEVTRRKLRARAQRIRELEDENQKLKEQLSELRNELKKAHDQKLREGKI